MVFCFQIMKKLKHFQNLQAAQELDELNDSNSFLTLAINSAVKTLEHSEVRIG
jgi:hypothetical protein